MGKQKNSKAKRSLSSLPKGLVQRKGAKSSFADINPFELTSRQKKPKHDVHNRPVSKAKNNTKHTLESLQRRQTQLRSTLKSSKKANVFIDNRIGQYDPTMSRDDQMLARLVKERSRQSQRISKFKLDDDDDNGNGGADDKRSFLTHKGKPMDPNKMSEAIYSDDEDDDNGNLAAVDTELHFGGGGISSEQQADPYGGASSAANALDLANVYGHRKTELDDLIHRRRILKAEKMQTKEAQEDTVEKMDEAFGELSQLLQFRKNEKAPVIRPKPTEEEIGMKEWNLEMKQIMMKPKRAAATDRTKTPEEIAKEESERLHEMETRRLARMNGDFEQDDLDDISVDGNNKKSKKQQQQQRKKERRDQRNPEELSDSDDEPETPEHEAVFTADGLVYVDKDGKVVKKVGDDDDDAEEEENENTSDENDSDISSSDQDDNEDATTIPLEVGARVKGNYRVGEQFDGQESWYDAVITKVNTEPDGTVTYDVDYDDNDFEENMIPKNVRAVEKSPEEQEKGLQKKEEEDMLKLKRKKARDKARTDIPYIFEVPTTLEALHELIAKYATTGEEASTIIERIHKANSVRLDRRNVEKMQNFYDVLLRRFVAVGDAIFASGNGGDELGRYKQLDTLTKVMYGMAQDHPESAGAVWSRRIGIFQNAHAKRLRDAEMVHEEEDDFLSAWPSTGTFLLLRVMGHIFPVTDKRHYVVTPAILLLGQMVAHTPILSMYDLVMGVLCSGLLLEYSKEAKRVVPEAIGFLAGAVRMYSQDPGHFSVPSLEAAHSLPAFKGLRDRISNITSNKKVKLPALSLERDKIMNDDSQMPGAILNASLDLIEKSVGALSGSFSISAESELFSEVSESLLTLRPKSQKNPLSAPLQQKVASTASAIANVCPSSRMPLRRRSGPAVRDTAVKSLAPRMEDPERYSMSKDKGKKSTQAAIDRTRREYKREHKAISRELRMDGAFIENERLKEQTKKDTNARAKRHKNYNWLEGEQASMNHEVRQGGGLLKGGGTGLARAKAATGQMGMKKGGKFS